MKEFADDNFKVDENGRKFSKWIENTVGKEEIARYEQFLLFYHSVFKKLVLQTHKNQGLFGKGLRDLTLNRNITCFNQFQQDSDLCILNLSSADVFSL